MNELRAYGCVLLTIFLTVYGQIIIKWRVMLLTNHVDSANHPYQFYINLFTNPWVLSALMAAFIASMAWMAAMSKLPLNVTYPFMSVSFPLVMVLSHYVFSESVSAQQMISIVLIMAGVALLGLQA